MKYINLFFISMLIILAGCSQAELSNLKESASEKLEEITKNEVLESPHLEECLEIANDGEPIEVTKYQISKCEMVGDELKVEYITS